MIHPGSGRPRLLLCINPGSGAGRGVGAGSEAAARLRSGGADVETLRVPGDDGTPAAARYAAALTERLRHRPGRGPDAVVVVGGDGMVHVTANVLAGTGIPLGVVPAGTGNDTVRSWGWAESGVRESTGRILRSLGHPPRSVDLARVELRPLGQGVAGPGATVVRYAVSGVNVAFDAAVNATANRLRWPRGGLRYVVAVLTELMRYRPAVLRVVVDGEPALDGPAFVLCIMNGRFIGGGMEVTPGTRVDDGILEAFHVPPLNPVRFLRVFPRVFSGRHTGIPEVTIRPARSVRIEGVEPASPPGPEAAGRGAAEHGAVVFGDGEPLGRLPATVTAADGMLAVLDDGEA
ncbi:diacylglycerol kinase family protein [Citricoccus sp. NPDC055426]|uniref:diacylglycerol/lipid kinase family protein n=1 Tax=Citricoccus sp. NPDC055426 TaxID=3155536 RepID=UPI00343CF085